MVQEFEVGKSVRLNDAALKRRGVKRGSPLGRTKGRIVSLESPFNKSGRRRWIEVVYGGKQLKHRYSDINNLEVIG